MSDPLGNLGVVPDPSWTSKWSEWPAARIDEYIRSVAGWSPLSRGQVRAIMDGVPPPPPGWPENTETFDDSTAAFSRFESDVEQGAIPATPLPEELVAWCRRSRIQLRSDFVAAVDQRHPPDMKDAQADEATFALPAWAPANLSSSQAPAAPRPRGRPRTAGHMYEEMIKQGNDLLLSHARQGEILTLRKIADILISRGLTGTMEHTSVRQRLKGELQFQLAKHLCAKYRQVQES